MEHKPISSLHPQMIKLHGKCNALTAIIYYAINEVPQALIASYLKGAMEVINPQSTTNKQNNAK
jgi:hypothetical protein